MTEPRARLRGKGQVFSTSDLSELLYAFGDSSHPLTATVTALDEILTDFIIESCHAAALCASYSRRQKIKADDFRWVLRKNASLLGRVQEFAAKEEYLKKAREIIDVNQYRPKPEDLAVVAQIGGADEEDLAVGAKGKRNKKKRKAEGEGRGGRKKRRES